ncbi:helix-turn-helix transcriptional regulator [Marinobacterium lutimaris]|uniref:DNA-binding transcriptional regulator, CsgD family n=1 Tax=Marinobacterium lutimaris TaxID=568106 RepID=A0A1H6C0Z6_9GAMM|nr:helix-turn-helix transcriptional regulator [Marinobacterium lutimaris]SEG66644.1 DNA-binding transcriptional regulator, CsgD family [Marinobacterium lutimaris]
MTSTSQQWPVDQLIASVGQRRFDQALSHSMHRLTGADHCVLVSYPSFKKNPYTLFSAGQIHTGLAQECRRLYDEVYYERDPNLACLQGRERKIGIQIRQQQVEELDDREYRHQLMDRCGIREKIAFMGVSNGQPFCLNLYRLHEPSRRALNAQPLEENGAVLAAILERHITFAGQQQVTFDFPWVMSRLQGACGDLLTARELDVGARIVLGYNSEAIALDLGISVNTVLTHRRHLYEKIGIGTQNQLFALVVEGRLPF